MLISGVTILRNGQSFCYPFLESLESMAPLCSEIVVNLDPGTDQTASLIEDWIRIQKSVRPALKVKVVPSQWPLSDPEKRKGGRILADETNKALDACSGDWCLYLQADEVLHEDDLDILRRELQVIHHSNLSASQSETIDALVFRYLHFYGTYDRIQVGRSAYRREVRMIRRGADLVSVGDAQSFRYGDGSKPRAALSRARVFHYGWVRPADAMKAKTGFMDTLYHQEASVDQPATGENYKYKRFVGLRSFRGKHPQVMASRIAQHPGLPWEQLPFVFQVKDLWKIISGWIEQLTGWRPFEYKSYRLLRRF